MVSLCLCTDCDKNNIAKIAYYETNATCFSYTEKMNNRKIFLCIECLKGKSHDQIKRAKKIVNDDKIPDPNEFITINSKGGKYVR